MVHNKKTSALRPAKIIAAGLLAALAAKKLYQNATKASLGGKVVLITGGSRGLGLALAMELARHKAHLILVARNAEHLAKAKRKLMETGCEVLSIQADLRNRDEVLTMVKKANEHFGSIDILINNAGIMVVGPENVMSIEDYKNVMDSNLWSALYTIEAAMPYFRRQGVGHIVNICSIGGKIAVPHMMPYSVSKFAMVGLSQGLCNELDKENIKVTTVIPNLMRTGSPRNITVKGRHETEYAWFKIADSLPFLSQSAENAAKYIVEAIQLGKTEITLTYTAKVVTALHAIIPGVFTAALRLVNRLLPDSQNIAIKKGHESESAASNNLLTSITDKAAIKYNQL
jgi:short-subunit dehydrogenase